MLNDIHARGIWTMRNVIMALDLRGLLSTQARLCPASSVIYINRAVVQLSIVDILPYEVRQVPLKNCNSLQGNSSVRRM